MSANMNSPMLPVDVSKMTESDIKRYLLQNEDCKTNSDDEMKRKIDYSIKDLKTRFWNDF